MSKELEAIFRSETKGIENTTGVLSRLTCKTFIDFNLKLIQWQNKLNRYLASKECPIPIDDLSKRSSFKGNLDKAIIKPEMTWEVFLTVVAVFGARKSTLTIRLNYPANEDRGDVSSEFVVDLKRATKKSLAIVYEEIVEHYKIKLSRWNDLVTQYIHNTAAVRPGDIITLSWLKGNINSKIRDKNLSIKNFTTILAILNPASVQLTLELQWHSGLSTLHTVNFTSRDTFGAKAGANKDDSK